MIDTDVNVTRRSFPVVARALLPTTSPDV